jgi:hypothetical protein
VAEILLAAGKTACTGHNPGGMQPMSVRTINLTVARLSPTGLALLEWGNWTGKPRQLGEAVVVPVASDDDYGHKVFHLFVYPINQIENQRPECIEARDLVGLDNNDVNDWWNTLAESLLDRIEKRELSIATPDEISEIPTPVYIKRLKGNNRNT